jgi:endonuclease YncB( thermonuclease family)
VRQATGKCSGPSLGPPQVERSMRACAVVVSAVLSTSAAAASWIVEGRVVGVSDGDTITVLDDAKAPHKIRFAGINAPENGQAFGERAKQSLSALVFQKRVEARCHKKDRHGREVCAVYVNLREVVELWFTDTGELDRAFASPQGVATMKHAAHAWSPRLRNALGDETRIS